MALNISSVRKQFPILTRRVNGKALIYLDNAATTQKPNAVIAAMDNYYRKHNANVHRGIHTLSEEATKLHEDARATIARHIGASPEEVIFTRNTTEGLNIVARSLSDALSVGDEILVTQMEHHSNLVPWQQAAKQTGATLKILPITDEGRWNMEELPRFLSKKTKIVAVNHCSNVLGTINPVPTLVRAAHALGAAVVVDGAQAVPHLAVNVRVLDADFYAFSGHKLYGPTGIGVLYGKRELLEAMNPLFFGGNMIKSVDWFSATWNDIPWKFEAGTPDIAGAVGLSEAIDWIASIGWDAIEHQERSLTQYALESLSQIPGLTIHGLQTIVNRVGVISFSINGVHPHDIATILNDQGIAIRSGHHCAMPLMVRLGVPATARVSLAIYNTKKEIDALIKGLDRVIDIFTPKMVVPARELQKNLWQKHHNE